MLLFIKRLLLSDMKIYTKLLSFLCVFLFQFFYWVSDINAQNEHAHNAFYKNTSNYYNIYDKKNQPYEYALAEYCQECIKRWQEESNERNNCILEQEFEQTKKISSSSSRSSQAVVNKQGFGHVKQPDKSCLIRFSRFFCFLSSRCQQTRKVHVGDTDES
jgi:hypothetical protein